MKAVPELFVRNTAQTMPLPETGLYGRKKGLKLRKYTTECCLAVGLPTVAYRTLNRCRSELASRSLDPVSYTHL
ncbi:hypothetical protein QN356_20695, partial [Pseudomonas sp. CCC3.1]